MTADPTPKLEKGLCVIEASAGTGKTYALCRIALRLMLERGIPIDRILCVTFTQAATLELKTRLRELLRDCLAQIDIGRPEEPVLQAALEAADGRPEGLRRALRRNLDLLGEAPISTIHGFCKRALEQAALEAAAPLDADLKNVEDEWVRRIRNQFVRINVAESSPHLAAAYKPSVHGARLDTIGRECAKRPFARVEPPAAPWSKKERLGAIDAAFAELPGAYAALLDDAPELLDKFAKNKKPAKWLDRERASRSLEAAWNRGFFLPEEIDALDHNDIAEAAAANAFKKARLGEPVPPFFALLDRYRAAVEAAFRSLAARYRKWLADQLKAEKRRLNCLTYNDLLVSLDAALSGESEGRLGQTLAQGYDAALVDEFQDTDPIQYRIFSKLFDRGGHFLFYIGDPKQAIYRFRGADVFAYLEATRSSNAVRRSLDTNYRAEPGLARATNALFEAAPDSFLIDQIQFRPVNPRPGPEAEAAETPAQDPFPPGIAFAALDAANRSRDETERALARAAARDLRAALESRPDAAAPSDVAILVNTNHQARLVAETLEWEGLPSAQIAERSVFQTEAASVLEGLLGCLARPTALSLQRGFLLAPVCGLGWPQLLLETAGRSAADLGRQIARWTDDWPRSSLAAAIDWILDRFETRPRLLASQGGERLLSDAFQLAALLDQAKRRERLSPQGLLDWLRRMRQADVSGEEAWQARLPSDAERIQILTIHKSKGLGFPVVLLPFAALLAPRPPGDHLVYHPTPRADDLVVHLDPEADSQARELALREEAAEQTRLLYVATTRAKRHATIYLARPPKRRRGDQPPALAQLLLGSEAAKAAFAAEDTLGPCLERLEALRQARPQISLRQTEAPPLPAQPRPSLRRPGATRANPPKARAFKLDRLPPPRRVVSFSSLSHGARLALEPDERDRDEEPADPAEGGPDLPDAAPGPLNWLARGVRTGDLVHAILERCDYESPESVRAETERACVRSGLRTAENARLLSEHLCRVLACPLAPDNAGPFALRDTPKRGRLTEAPFSLRTGPNAWNQIAAAFAERRPDGYPDAWIQRLKPDRLADRSAYLRGVIDLLVESDDRLYIVDWKTNWLGPSEESYGEDALRHALGERDYFLQYTLYAVALQRYLKLRQPGNAFEASFGGVFYLFVRGMRPGSRYGIHFHRPDPTFIEALSAAL